MYAKPLVKELQDIGGCSMTSQLILDLGDTNANKISKGKGEETTGLGVERVGSASGATTG